jgi:uncharacterized membrane protein YgdD (TMEM256/DUF423 family)
MPQNSVTVLFVKLFYLVYLPGSVNACGLTQRAACTRSPAKSAGAMVVGVAAFSGSLRDLKLVPTKWRCLVPPAGNAHR